MQGQIFSKHRAVIGIFSVDTSKFPRELSSYTSFLPISGTTIFQ
jgi:hypothetical protein